jgi:PAS domain S-box-containing protein
VKKPFPDHLAADSAEWLRVTLSCIGDGVITTDQQGRVTFLNPVAQALTGWTQEQVAEGGGVPIERVFNIINEETRAKVESPTVRALREGAIVGLANHTILVAKDGTEVPIDDSAAPIRNTRGETAGAVLVFRDVTGHKVAERLVRDAKEYAENILDTQREAFLVLDNALRVVSANRSFYRTFRVEKDATEGRFIYDLGDSQWNIPKLRELLEEVLPNNHVFEGFEVSHDFPAGVGHKTMLLNVRKIFRPGNNSELILLAIEDVTERMQAQQAQRDSELRYRRVFETAKDGILILDANTGKITDANAFMCEMMGRVPR